MNIKVISITNQINLNDALDKIKEEMAKIEYPLSNIRGIQILPDTEWGVWSVYIIHE